ncbi:hypothetical protein HDR63_01985, partial [bacterium]|nr:hypothetical protein [bacterium]
MITATLPTSKQVLGYCALGVLRKYGFAAGLSDLAVLLGGTLGNADDQTPDGRRAGYTWTSSRDNELAIECVGPRGTMVPYYPCKRDFSVRPVLPALTTEQILPTCPRNKVGNITQFQWGEYPQTDCTDILGADANRATPTGQFYTFDQNNPLDCDNPFHP